MIVRFWRLADIQRQPQISAVGSKADGRSAAANCATAALFSFLFAMCDTVPERFLDGRGRTMTSLRLLVALCATVVWAELCYADCSSLHALAQQHANDMARRNSLDHAGFMARRGPAGAVAENVAMGCETEACARRMWMQSPPHRANMMLGGCQAVASCGFSQWPSVLGDGDRRQQSCWYSPYWCHSHSGCPQRQR